MLNIPSFRKTFAKRNHSFTQVMYKSLTGFTVLAALMVIMMTTIVNAKSSVQVEQVKEAKTKQSAGVLTDMAVFNETQQTIESVVAQKIEEEKEVLKEEELQSEFSGKKITAAQEAMSNSVFKITSAEYEILTRIVEAEATGQDVKSKQIIANVILNRVNNKKFPNTIKGVVFQKRGKTAQFSPITDGRYYSVKITKESQEAVNRALSGEDNSQGALFFACRSAANPKNMRWFDTSLKPLFQYGGHEYFTFK